MTYNGPERRRSKFNERDYLLVKIDATVENILKEFKEHKEDFKEHKQDDSIGFKSQTEQINTLNIKIALATGFVIAINFLLRFIRF